MFALIVMVTFTFHVHYGIIEGKVSKSLHTMWHHFGQKVCGYDKWKSVVKGLDYECMTHGANHKTHVMQPVLVRRGNWASN